MKRDLSDAEWDNYRAVVRAATDLDPTRLAELAEEAQRLLAEQES